MFHNYLTFLCFWEVVGMGSLIITQLQIYCRMRKWKNFKNRSILCVPKYYCHYYCCGSHCHVLDKENGDEDGNGNDWEVMKLWNVAAYFFGPSDRVSAGADVLSSGSGSQVHASDAVQALVDARLSTSDHRPMPVQAWQHITTHLLRQRLGGGRNTLHHLLHAATDPPKSRVACMADPPAARRW